jgi:hypothetical protein
VAIHGSIEEAGLPNVLQLVALGGKTGCIAVERANVHGAIYLDGGMVVWAEIVTAGDRLGDHLVRSGKITREQLRSAIVALTEDSTRSFVGVLVDAGAIARGELDRFIQHQVEEAVYLMCSWTKGQFTFTANTRPPRHANPVSLHAERLLLEAGRRADDWLVIQQAIPSFDRVYRRAALRPGAASGPELGREHHRILPLLDGTRDVNGLIELSGMSAFEVAKALLDLIMTGAVQLQERSSSARHFEEAELQGYALRAGEFVDPERRKDAARHIADCQMCGGRLREFQARRKTVETDKTRETGKTDGGYVVTDAKPQPPAPPKTQPPAPAVAAPPPAKPPAAASPRKTSDLVWIMSPEEADEVRRSTAAAMPKPAVPVPGSAETPPPPPPKPPAPKAGMTAPRKALVPPPPSPAAKAARVSQAAPVERPSDTRAVPLRALALAAVGVVVLAAGIALRSRRGPPVTAPTSRAPVVAGASAARAAAPLVEPTHDSLAAATPPVEVRAAPPRDTPGSRVSAPLIAPAASSPAPAREPTPRAAPTPAPAPATEPLAPDAELAAGGWRVIDRAEAIAALGGRLGAIPGLRIESFASSEARGRTRVRVAQLARTGQRIVLIETAGSDASGSASARATAVSVMPPLESSGESIGSASLGNLQITARSSLAPDALRPLLGRLGFISGP